MKWRRLIGIAASAVVVAAGLIVIPNITADAAATFSPGDVFGISVKGASGKTEVHSLNRKDRYHSYAFHGPTGMGKTSLSLATFGIGDYDGDRIADLFVVDTNDSRGTRTAVHILSGASKFRSALLHRRLNGIGATSLSRWQYSVGDYNGDGRADLFAVDTRDGNGTKTAAHVFNAATGLSSFLMHQKLPNLGATSLKTWQFAAGDYNRDGKADLFAVNTRDGKGTRTAAHVFNAATGLRTFLLQLQLPGLGATSLDRWQFTVGDHNVDGRADLYAINSRDQAGRTAVHVLNAKTGLRNYLAHSVSALHNTSLDTWQFHSWSGRSQSSPVRERIVATAAARIGDSEANGRCTEFGPCQSYAWCAMFAEWVWRSAGVASVPTTWVATDVGTWGINHGKWKARPAGSRGNPLPGDIAVYGAPGSGVGGHVGIVASVNADGTITTIDGNWGNAVVRRTINPVTATGGSRGVRISGYVTP